MSVSVVGAGVTGLSVAFHLTERGIGPVTVFDRGGVGAGASGVQPGGVRQQWGTRANCLMARESHAFYRDFPARVDTVARARFDPCGYLFVADEPATLSRLASGVAVQHEVGVPSRMLEPAEAAELVPGLAAGFLGASWCDEDGYFDRPQAVVEAFAEVALRQGASLLREEVLRVERDGGGWRLVTSAGARSADVVVVAAGYDTPALLAPLGFALPIVREPRYLFFSEPVRERLLEPLVIALDRGVAAKQLADGRVLASDLRAQGRDEDAWRRRIREQLLPLAPVLEYVALPVMAEGFYDMTPDGQPIVGALAEGLWVAAGFSGHGFMVAPSTGRLVAAALAGSPLPEWSEALRAKRFEGGSRDREAQVI
jgi:glycine/D-amino acid oxidase-like deaminating enzyme